MKCSGKGCKNAARPDRTKCQRCADYSIKYQKRNREKGLCRCGKPPAKGKTACSKCLAKMVDYITRRRAERKAKGLCGDCGNPAEFNQVRCLACGQKYRAGEAQPVVRARREAALKQTKQEKEARHQALADFIESRIYLIDDPRTVDIVKSRHVDKQTLEEIGLRLGICRERVRQIQAKADKVLFSNVIVVDKSAEGVARQAQNLTVIGLASRTNIHRSTTGKEFYQYLNRE